MYWYIFKRDKAPTLMKAQPTLALKVQHYGVGMRINNNVAIPIPLSIINSTPYPSSYQFSLGSNPIYKQHC